MAKPKDPNILWLANRQRILASVVAFAQADLDAGLPISRETQGGAADLGLKLRAVICAGVRPRDFAYASTSVGHSCSGLSSTPLGNLNA